MSIKSTYNIRVGKVDRNALLGRMQLIRILDGSKLTAYKINTQQRVRTWS